MIFLNEYTIKEFGLKGDCAICDCGRCTKSCTECDWIAIHGPVNCYGGGVKNCPYMPKPFEKTHGLFSKAAIKQQAEQLVFISMSRGDIEKECQKRGIKINRQRANMESELVEMIYKEMLENQ